VNRKDATVIENDYFYQTVCSLVDREAADAIDVLARYVRLVGDYVLVRSDLDHLDRAFREINEILNQKWKGQCWSKR
jgi:hypothetical protein